MLLHNGIRLCSANVPVLTNAIASDYRFTVKKDGQLNDTPEKKHPVSDVCDALQYAALVAAGEYTGKINRLLNKRRGPVAPAPPTRGWT